MEEDFIGMVYVPAYVSFKGGRITTIDGLCSGFVGKPSFLAE
jgi:hypothetical protein